MPDHPDLAQLAARLQGELLTDEVTRRLYATDASAYRELPLAVAIPRTEQDLLELVQFASKHRTSLIPRTAGTSLAGQVVGSGIVVDLSVHFNRILEVNPTERWVRVQPGIVRDDLNRALQVHGLFFAPETSTANRAMIGGMIGNNSCGSNSVVYGSTREHLLEVDAILADGTLVNFKATSDAEFHDLVRGQNAASPQHHAVYQQVHQMLTDPQNRAEIRAGYPEPGIPRRNTGYALDMLLRQRPFDPSGSPFNFCTLLAGSEGTLALITTAKLLLSPLPPRHQRLVCIHCHSIDESLRANLVALRFSPSACELMDHYILEATERNVMYAPYRWFVEGHPQALLVVELLRDSETEANDAAANLIAALRSEKLGYAYPIIEGEQAQKVWGLRKAGLGLLSNIPGDAKPVPVIEDTAVAVNDLPQYIADFNQILTKHGLYSVHYAHAGSGELHLRPIIDLKTADGVRLFRVIAEEIAHLVKKYRGSLSGEHGDGRLRGEFIPLMLGPHNYELCREIKRVWDPQGLFNPGKITDTPPMDTNLRFPAGNPTPDVETMLDFSEAMGFARAAEQCNGSGDCRKTALSGGTMCPSYMATRREQDTTRARANILREMLTRSDRPQPLASEEIKDVMDLCLSCKGCKSECPSNVDVAKLKAEWQHQYYQATGIPLRTRLIGSFETMMWLSSFAPWMYDWMFSRPFPGRLLKRLVGFAPERSMPHLARQTVTRWFKRRFVPTSKGRSGKVCMFIDEFTNYNDAEIGITAIKLLDRLGFRVRLLPHRQSGRSYISKGLLKPAQKLARFNVNLFSEQMEPDEILVGTEPSAILTFRDEYISLLRGEEQDRAKALAQRTKTIEEFLADAITAGKIQKEQFTSEAKLMKVHGHCHQKALSNMAATRKILTFPVNYRAELIPSGCCGMAGSFGYEHEHFELSMQIGELVLFPAIREQPPEVEIVAVGTSCRHQIKDGTQRIAKHPVEILFEAML
ncbi:MAG: FAD-binding protein [Planctomycetaceae bacterium]|nr:FAD-binding protein [Planctomycetaceae bacterium]